MGEHKRPPDVARSQWNEIRYLTNVIGIVPYSIHGTCMLKLHRRRCPMPGFKWYRGSPPLEQQAWPRDSKWEGTHWEYGHCGDLQIKHLAWEGSHQVSGRWFRGTLLAPTPSTQELTVALTPSTQELVSTCLIDLFHALSCSPSYKQEGYAWDEID